MAQTVSPKGSLWRLFPLWLTLSFVVVFAINGYMAYSAITTFPGDAVQDDFGTSNRYDQVLDRAQHQANLGWALQAQAVDGRPLLVLRDRLGHVITQAVITARAQRLLGPPQTATVTFKPESDGQYRADIALPQPGQWELQLRVQVADQMMAATRRVVVR